MKKFLFLLLFPVFASAQSKNDSKIIVTVSDTVRLFDKLITLLYTEGYTVRTEDKARGFIVTDDKTMKHYLKPTVRLTLAVKDSLVTVTGQFNDNMNYSAGIFEIKSGFEPIVNKGVKGSMYKVIWNEMDRLAKLIGDKIVYTK